jgi:hypothetical protein
VTREEIWHHTDEQLVEYVRRATNALEECTLEPAERAALLPVLVNLASAKTINFGMPAQIVAPAMAIPRGRH